MKGIQLALLLSVAGLASCAALPSTPNEAPSRIPKRAVHSGQLKLEDLYTPKGLSEEEHGAHRVKVLAGACNVNAFATTSSSQLEQELINQGADCVNGLFSAAAGTQATAFNTNNMIAIANSAASRASSYQGGGSEVLRTFWLYLRAGYYAAFYNTQLNFGSGVTPAVKVAIDAMFANPHYLDGNDLHGKQLSECITLVDSSEQQDVYMNEIANYLNHFDQKGYGNYWYTRACVNEWFTVMFRGLNNAAYKAAIPNANSLVRAVSSFALKQNLVGTNSEYLIVNAARELGRLTQITTGSIQGDLTSGLTQIFSTYPSYGAGDGVYLGAADTVGYYGQCATYGVCDVTASLEGKVFAKFKDCSSTIKVRYEDLTAVQLDSVCSTLGKEEAFFHNKLQTGKVPIPGDVNTQLHVNIFNSEANYKKYAPLLFNGMNTNNGGMYLEGSSMQAGNIPNFVCFEASYGNPPHNVWNLEHEYVHYLDGRFDMQGDFGASGNIQVVWWSEGLAEYISHLKNNQAAVDTVNDGSTYTLRQVFDTTYDGFDQDRIYRWGYLAVRFMFEKHLSEVIKMREFTRNGQWTQYKSMIDTWAANYGNEFATWTVTDLQSGSGSTPAPYYPPVTPTPYTPSTPTPASPSTPSPVTPSPSTPTPSTIGNTLSNGRAMPVSGAAKSDTFYMVTIPAGAKNLLFRTTGGTGDVDLFVKAGAEPATNSYDCRPYASGNEEQCKISNITPGVYYVMLRGYSDYSSSLVVSWVDDSGTGNGNGNNNGGNVPNACATGTPMTTGTIVAGKAVCLGAQDPLWLPVSGLNGHSVAITTSGGSGDISIEFSTDGWPTGNGVKSQNPGNNECVIAPQSSSYWGYIKVTGSTGGVNLIVDLDKTSCRQTSSSSF